MSFLWGSAPNPARFFEKSGGKTIFYRRISHSLRSCDIRRLFLILLDFGLSFTSVNNRSQGWRSAALNFADEALRGIYWALPKTRTRDFYGALPKTHMSFLWGSAPNPARFFEKSGGKTIFYRRISHSLRSCDIRRLFLILLDFGLSFTFIN